MPINFKKIANSKGFKFGRAHRLARANYLPRVIGMGAAFVVITLLVIERDWSYWYFPFMAVFFLIYPHLVLLLSKARPDNKKVEIQAMLFESLVLGMWVTGIQFYLWESYALFAGLLITNTMIGGFQQMFKSLLLFVGGIILGGVLMGFKFQLEAPYFIDVASMITLIFFITNVAASFFAQAHKLAGIRIELEDKNRMLNETIKELKSTRDELVKKAHKAGMADLATGVLHNIGNILNSVNISTTVIEETLRHSKIPKLRQANALLDEHKDNLEEFLLEDPRGMKLLNYYLKLEDPLGEEHQELTTHCDRLIEKVQLMLEVIDAQQNFAKVGRINEKVRLEQVVNDTLTLQSGSIERHGLKIEKEFAATDKVIVQKSKLIHILINLFKNAKEAMADVHPDNKKITIQTLQDEDNVILSIADKGIGIKDEDLNKVFNHGFTTKKSGHGFGLHTCANYMTEMDGSIRVESEGKGKGAKFTLVFPKVGFRGNTAIDFQQDKPDEENILYSLQS